MGRKRADGSELVFLEHYYIGSGPDYAKVGVSADGELSFHLPTPEGEESVVVLENRNAVQILRELVAILDDPSRWPQPPESNQPSLERGSMLPRRTHRGP